MGFPAKFDSHLILTDELPNGLVIAGLNSGTPVDRADVWQATGAR